MFRLRPVMNAVKNVQSFALMKDSVKAMNTTALNIPVVPDYNINKPQTLEKRKARLLYQSRKRGMLENDLLLSTFVKLYLERLTEEQTIMYDRLINGPFSDWDIYYWIVEKQPTPKEYDNEIMDMLKKHAKNESKVILSQPELF